MTKNHTEDLADLLVQAGLLPADFSGGLKSDQNFYDLLKKHSPDIFYRIYLEDFGNIPGYMVIFRTMANLAQLEHPVRRVVAERASENDEIINFSFYCEDQKHTWQFKNWGKWLNTEFIDKSVIFLRPRSSQVFVRFLDENDCFYELAVLPRNIWELAEKSGLQLALI